MGKMKISEEERLRRSENAKALIASGKLGGKQYGKLGGRPKNKRSSELVAEKAAEEADKIWKKLREIIFESESEKLSLEAIKHVHSLEEQERKVNVEEEVRYEQLKHNELLALVVGNLQALAADGRIEFAEVIDGDAFEVETRPAIGPGEIN